VTTIPKNYSTTQGNYFDWMEATLLQFVQQQPANATVLAQVKAGVNQLFLHVGELTNDFSSLTKTFVSSIQSAETAQEVFQVQGRRTWEYLLQQQTDRRDER
jgi:hypothetical protein